MKLESHKIIDFILLRIHSLLSANKFSTMNSQLNIGSRIFLASIPFSNSHGDSRDSRVPRGILLAIQAAMP